MKPHLRRQSREPTAGKYFDWFEGKTLDRPITTRAGILTQLERELIDDLIERHIENYMAALPRLYAILLIKTLCQSDPDLMEEFGQRVAALDYQRRHVEEEE